MDGKSFIDELMMDVGKIQNLTTDANLRSIALRWLRRVIKDISARHPHWTWLESTQTFPTLNEIMSYDLPLDIDLSGHKLFDLRQYTTPAKLVYISQRRFDELQPDPTIQTGAPLYYTIFATSLKLWPVPDAAINMYMRYIKTIAVISDSETSTTDIPAKFDEVVLDGAKVHAFKYFPEWGDSREQKQIYEGGVLEMKRDNNISLDSENFSYSDRDSAGVLKEYPYQNQRIGS